MEATQQGYAHMVQLLLEAGGDTEIPNAEGLTPLHVTITRKRHGILDLLLQHGADKNKVLRPTEAKVVIRDQSIITGRGGG